MSRAEGSRTPSRWTGLSAEERQRERRQLLVDAAYDLLATEGSAGTTVRAVCAKARLNPRYFYENFDDLDSLIVAVYDGVVHQLGTSLLPGVTAATDEDEAMRAIVSGTVQFVAEDPRRGQILYIAALDNEALNRRRLRTGVALMEMAQDERSTWPEGADAEVAKLAAAVVVGGFNEVLTAWIEGRIDLDPERLADHATRVFIGVRDSMRVIDAAS